MRHPNLTLLVAFAICVATTFSASIPVYVGGFLFFAVVACLYAHEMSKREREDREMRDLDEFFIEYGRKRYLTATNQIEEDENDYE